MPSSSRATFGVGLIGVHYENIYNKLQQTNKEIKHLSFHDSLTNLYNRRFFEKELKRLNTERQLPVSIMIVDINNMKKINDSYGHKKGDEMLIKTAKLLKKVLRKEAKKIKQRIRNSFNESQNDNISISVGIGWAAKRNIEEDISQVLKKADDNMYKDKLNAKKENI